MPSSAEADDRQRSRGGSRAWLGVAALLLLGSVACAGVSPTTLDWQPGLAWQQPWRAWTAAWVHYSPLHLLANLAGGVLVAVLGLVARLPRRAALAWLVAWPLTQLGLLLRPDLLHYGGLSGVLHAGVVVAATCLVVARQGPHRWIGAAVLLGVAAKVALEAPLGPALRQPAGWDIPVAPFAHLCGFVAGALAALVAMRVPPPARTRPRTIAGDG